MTLNNSIITKYLRRDVRRAGQNEMLFVESVLLIQRGNRTGMEQSIFGYKYALWRRVTLFLGKKTFLKCIFRVCFWKRLRVGFIYEISECEHEDFYRDFSVKPSDAEYRVSYYYMEIKFIEIYEYNISFSIVNYNGRFYKIFLSYSFTLFTAFVKT